MDSANLAHWVMRLLLAGCRDRLLSTSEPGDSMRNLPRGNQRFSSRSVLRWAIFSMSSGLTGRLFRKSRPTAFGLNG